MVSASLRGFNLFCSTIQAITQKTSLPNKTIGEGYFNWIIHQPEEKRKHQKSLKKQIDPKSVVVVENMEEEAGLSWGRWNVAIRISRCQKNKNKQKFWPSFQCRARHHSKHTQFQTKVQQQENITKQQRRLRNQHQQDISLKRVKKKKFWSVLTSWCSDPLRPHTWLSPFPAALPFICGKYLSHILHELQRKCVTIAARDTKGNRCVQHLKSSKPVFSNAQLWAHQISYCVNEQWQADRTHCVRTVLDAVVLRMSSSIAQHVSRVFLSKANTVTKWFSLRNVLRVLTLNLPGQIINLKKLNLFVGVFIVVS